MWKDRSRAGYRLDGKTEENCVVCWVIESIHNSRETYIDVWQRNALNQEDKENLRKFSRNEDVHMNI